MNSLQYLSELRATSLRMVTLLWPCLALVTNFAVAEITVEVNQPEPVHVEFDLSQWINSNAMKVQASLGEYDISSLVSYDASGFYLLLNAAVEEGSYPLRIAASSGNADAVILVEESIVFVKNIGQLGAELRSNTSYRIDESEADAFNQSVARLTESALRLQASRLYGKTSIQSSADIQHRSDGNTLSGDKLEIANYNFAIKRKTDFGSLGVSFGNQYINQQSLVFNGFNRRGFGAQIEETHGRYRIKTFYINSDPEVSAEENVILPEEKHEQSFGTTLDFEIFRNDPGRLRISSGYIYGESELQGTGIGFSSSFFVEEQEPIIYGGKTWHVSASSAWLEHSLQFQIEQARSLFDSDGLDIGEKAKSDKASRYALILSSQGRLSNMLKPLGINSWQLNWQQQTVGENFYSLANIGLPGDLQTNQTALQFAWSQVQFSTSIVSAENNTDKRTEDATQTSDQTQFSASYIPAISNDGGFWRVIGRPSFSARLNETQRSQSPEHALLVGFDLDDKTREEQISATFQRQTINWSMQHSRTYFQNDAEVLVANGFTVFTPGPDTENRFTSLNINFIPSQTFSFFPSAQWTDYEETQTRNRQDAFNIGFSSNLRLLKDRVTIALNYNRIEQSTHLENIALNQKIQNQTSSVVAGWQVIRPRGMNPGVKLSLRHTRNEQKVSFQQDSDNYQVHLGMELYWEKGKGQ